MRVERQVCKIGQGARGVWVVGGKADLLEIAKRTLIILEMGLLSTSARAMRTAATKSIVWRYTGGE